MLLAEFNALVSDINRSSLINYIYFACCTSGLYLCCLPCSSEIVCPMARDRGGVRLPLCTTFHNSAIVPQALRGAPTLFLTCWNASNKKIFLIAIILFCFAYSHFYLLTQYLHTTYFPVVLFYMHGRFMCMRMFSLFVYLYLCFSTC